MLDDRDRHWESHVPEGQKYLRLDDYIEASFGMIDGKGQHKTCCLFFRCNHHCLLLCEDLSQVHDKNKNLTFNDIIKRYERRFKKADQDGNNLLDKDEFADFLHPREKKESYWCTDSYRE